MRVTKQTWATVIAVALSSAAQVDSVHAQQVTMPETVQAQADGTFSFTAEFTAGAEEVLVAYWEWFGLPLRFPATQPGGGNGSACGGSCMAADSDCRIGPFEMARPLAVTGKLSSPNTGATVSVVMTRCPAGQFAAAQATTTIVPAAQGVPSMPIWAVVIAALGLVATAFGRLSRVQ